MELTSVEKQFEARGEAVLGRQDFVGGMVDLLQQGDLKTAARYYLQSNEDVGYQLIDAAELAGLALPLAKVLLAARDYYKAAQVLEKMDRFKEAAQSFERAESYSYAADLFIKIGDVGKGAENFERSGAHDQAAEFYAQAERWADAARNFSKVDRHFEAGETYVKANDDKQALKALQMVTPEDPSYVQAVTLLGPIWQGMGFPELALQKYEELTNGVVPNESNLGLFYAMGSLYELLGKREAAQNAFGKIMEKDLTYSDAKDRYMALKSSPASETPPTQEVKQAVADQGVVVLDEDRSFFEESVLFQNLTYNELRLFLSQAEKRTFAAEEVIQRAGDQIVGLCVIQEGELDVLMKTEGKNHHLAKFKRSDYFGEMTVLGPKEALASIVARTPGSCLCIPRDKVEAILNQDASLRARMLANMLAALEKHFLITTETIKALWSRET